MLKRLYRLIALGVLSVSLVTGNVVFASETPETVMTPSEEPETPAPEPETAMAPSEEPETPAPEPETPAPQPETPAPQPETPAPQPETPAPEPETPAPQPETSAPEPETSAPQTEAPKQTEAPQTEAPKQTEAPQTEGASQAQAPQTEALSAESANHSTAIPENPSEKKQNIKIVDAKENDPEKDASQKEIEGEWDLQMEVPGFTVDPSVYPAADVGVNTCQIYHYLRDTLDLNHAASCGVLANVDLESGFNPLALGDSGTSYGICQWHYGRFSSLVAYCQQTGADYNTVPGQLTYLKYELENGYGNVLSYIRNVPDTADGAYDAAHYFCTFFEAPDQTEARAQQRGNLAKNEYYVQEYPRVTENGLLSEESGTISDIRGIIEKRYSVPEIAAIENARVGAPVQEDFDDVLKKLREETADYAQQTEALLPDFHVGLDVPADNTEDKQDDAESSLPETTPEETEAPAEEVQTENGSSQDTESSGAGAETILDIRSSIK